MCDPDQRGQTEGCEKLFAPLEISSFLCLSHLQASEGAYVNTEQR